MRHIVTLMLALLVVTIGGVGSASAQQVAPEQKPTATQLTAQPTTGAERLHKAHHHHAKPDVYERLIQRIPLYVRQAFVRVGDCESGGHIDINTGNGFYGWLQFTGPTWRSLGYHDMPYEASRAKQLWAGFRNARIQGWQAWPRCSVKVGATRINIRAIRLRRYS